MLDGTSPSTGSSPSIPSEVGAYKIHSIIGMGGMGTVCRCRHRNEFMADRQGGDVCIKTMHPQYANDPTFQARFEREASLGLKLDHPGIIKVHDLVMDAGTLALVMEYVEGRSLADMIGLETGPIPWAKAWPLFSQLLDAVGHAHEHGIIHRDLKPDNVMVTPTGQLKVLDFGIAKEAGATAAMTAGGMGTADYMAPEQHTDAKNVDARSDIYALGMTLYEMLAGRLPWGDELDILGLLLRKQHGDIPPPSKFYPDIPPEVVATVMLALAPQREARPWSVLALRQALDRAGRTPAVVHIAAPPTPVATSMTVVESDLPPPEISGYKGQLPPPGYPQPAGAPFTGEPRINGMALFGLILAFIPPFAMIGLILSIVGLIQVNNSHGIQKGRGLAMAGIVVAAIMLVVMLVGSALLPLIARM